MLLVYIQIQYIMIVHGNSTIQISDFQSHAKKNALNKLSRMSRVIHNAKSIENRYNSFKILTKLFETSCPLHERPHHFEKVKQLINIPFCGYQRRLEIGDCRSTKWCRNLYSPGAQGAPASNKCMTLLFRSEIRKS
jgi:hypothetical protein